MPRPAKSPWISFWPMWLAANAASLYFIMGLFALPSVGTGIGAAVLLSILQWLLLRWYVGVTYTWFVAGIVVYSSFLIMTMAGALHSILPFLATCLISLGMLGLLQRGALRDHVDGAGLWPIASAGIAMLAYAVLLLFRPAEGYRLSTFWLIFSVAYGAGTGVVLIWLKQRTNPYVDNSVPPWKRSTAN